MTRSSSAAFAAVLCSLYADGRASNQERMISGIAAVSEHGMCGVAMTTWHAANAARPPAAAATTEGTAATCARAMMLAS